MILGFSPLAGSPIAGKFQPAFTPPNQKVAGTDKLNLPINCVIAGQQPEEKKTEYVTDMYGILKRIFRET